jgi:hypothetical protein
MKEAVQLKSPRWRWRPRMSKKGKIKNVQFFFS